MQDLLSILLVTKPLNVTILNENISLKYGDIILTRSIDRLQIPSRKDYTYEVNIGLDTIKKHIHQNNLNTSHTQSKKYQIVRNAPFMELTLSIIENINITPHPYPKIRELGMLTLLSIISMLPSTDSLIISSIPSLSDKVKSTIISNIKKKWMLHDIAILFHMSESLLKKKLSDEGTSFSEILLETRMNMAIILLNENKSIKQVSIDCGFSNTSYFIQSFKRYYGITPKEHSKDVKKNETEILKSKI